HLLAGDARLQELVDRQLAHALDAVAQVAPERRGVASPRQVGRQPHDRDVVLAHFSTLRSRSFTVPSPLGPFSVTAGPVTAGPVAATSPLAAGRRGRGWLAA